MNLGRCPLSILCSRGTPPGVYQPAFLDSLKTSQFGALVHSPAQNPLVDCPDQPRTIRLSLRCWEALKTKRKTYSLVCSSAQRSGRLQKHGFSQMVAGDAPSPFHGNDPRGAFFYAMERLKPDSRCLAEQMADPRAQFQSVFLFFLYYFEA